MQISKKNKNKYGIYTLMIKFNQHQPRRITMKKSIFLSLLTLMLCSFSFAQETEGFEGRPITENISMQTGYTLNEGEFEIGIGPMAIGITDQVQIETNIFLFIFQVYNAKVKVTAVETDEMSFSAGLDYTRLDLEKITGGTKIGITMYSPYLVLSKKVGSKTTFHLSGKYSFANVDLEYFESNGMASGTDIMAGLDYNLSHKTKLLAETGYDMSYKGFRVAGAVLFGWENFRLKLGVSYFKPDNTLTGNDISYTAPVVGFWWRFNG